MLENVKELLFPGVGVIQQVDEVNEPTAIKYAYLNNSDEVVTVYVDGSMESLPVKQGSIEPYAYGYVLFSTADGGDYVIRPLEDMDGDWISRYKMSIPGQALPYLLFESEESAPMPYLDDQNERLIAFKSPDDETVFGLMYINKSGAYMRINESWLALSPADQSFDDSIAYDVLPETAQEFVDMFDDAEITLPQVEKYLQPVK